MRMKRFGKDRSYQKLLGAVLSRHVGQGRDTSVAELAQGVDCSPTVIYALQRQQMEVSVSAELFAAILQKMPEAAMEEFLHSLGYAGARRIDNLPACWKKTVSMMTGFLHSFAKADEDNFIDHREERELFRYIGPLRSMLARFGRVES